ncbi:DNA polymerase III subunit delta' [Reinekea thalattae]|uniref:DNA polymerase III subunit delta' n=1 Tax=Reinekea thalattae TaxID=2593301 RepID=UPI00165049DF|nr:DNA polymerase III subunit delta' [Reinekea thalattae]
MHSATDVQTVPIWLTADQDKLLTQYRQGRLPHGILLVGHAGDGREVLTDKIIEALFCTQLQANQACGECKSCKLFATKHHPDYVRIEPEGKSQTIKVDAIRSIVQKVTGTAQQGGNKVVRIESAECMNLSAANALLKILEEPAANTYIFLATHELSRLLPTLRSRCRIQTLARPTEAQAAAFLQQQGYQNLPELALAITNGHPMLAAKLTEQDVQRWQETEAKLATEKQFMELSRYISGQDMAALIRQMMLWLDTAIRAQQQSSLSYTGISTTVIESLVKQDASRLFALRDYLVNKLSAISRQANLNPQMMAEGIASQWLSIQS